MFTGSLWGPRCKGGQKSKLKMGLRTLEATKDRTEVTKVAFFVNLIKFLSDEVVSMSGHLSVSCFRRHGILTPELARCLRQEFGPPASYMRSKSICHFPY